MTRSAQKIRYVELPDWQSALTTVLPPNRNGWFQTTRCAGCFHMRKEHDMDGPCHPSVLAERCECPHMMVVRRPPAPVIWKHTRVSTALLLLRLQKELRAS